MTKKTKKFYRVVVYFVAANYENLNLKPTIGETTYEKIRETREKKTIVMRVEKEKKKEDDDE